MGLKESKGPLRLVVRFVRQPIFEGCEHDVTRELLECGHVVKIRKDIRGETNAYRRRCRFCRDS